MALGRRGGTEGSSCTSCKTAKGPLQLCNKNCNVQLLISLTTVCGLEALLEHSHYSRTSLPSSDEPQAPASGTTNSCSRNCYLAAFSLLGHSWSHKAAGRAITHPISKPGEPSQQHPVTQGNGSMSHGYSKGCWVEVGGVVARQLPLSQGPAGRQVERNISWS